MIQRFLKVAEIGNLETGKNGQYITVKFFPKYMLNDGTPIASALSDGTRNVFGSSTGPNGEEYKEDGLFRDIMNGTIKVGSLVEGELCRVQTTPYKIPNRDKEATSYTCVRFAHENLADYVNKQLKAVYACMLSTDGLLTAPDQCNKPVNATHSKDLVTLP